MWSDQFVAAILPWLMHGVWNANSLMECRQIIADRYGDGVLEKVSGACWAVIRERWHQYLFGFYPSDQYWRPTMALALMFVALTPALFLDNARAGSIPPGHRSRCRSSGLDRAGRHYHPCCSYAGAVWGSNCGNVDAAPVALVVYPALSPDRLFSAVGGLDLGAGRRIDRGWA
ncbi:MAG: hypothetical protein V9G14_17180 [Cypionkella sp.]